MATATGNEARLFEYPDGQSGADTDEVDQALERAEEIVAYVQKVIDTLGLLA